MSPNFLQDKMQQQRCEFKFFNSTVGHLQLFKMYKLFKMYSNIGSNHSVLYTMLDT